MRPCDEQVLSSLPSRKWAGTAGGEALGKDTLEQLLELNASFAKARQLLREMGEVIAPSATPSELC